MKLTFYVVKGLVDVAKNELEKLGVRVTSVENKQIHGEYSGKLIDLQQLRTVDDVIIEICKFSSQSASIEEELQEQISQIDFNKYIKSLLSVRKLNSTFSLTISKYKVKLDRERLKQDLSIQITKVIDWKYTEKSHDNFDIRISIEKNNVVIGIRLFTKPLHQRGYVNENYLGSLKPTIASSFYSLAINKTDSERDIKLVDNFCGSGTILCEAYLQGASVSGGDINDSAVKITQSRLNSLGSKGNFINQQSAFSSSRKDSQFNMAISNPPWDEQLAISSITELYSESIKEYKRILSEDAILCFIAKKPDLLIKHIKLNFPSHKIETRRISFNGQQPTIILAYSDK